MNENVMAANAGAENMGAPEGVAAPELDVNTAANAVPADVGGTEGVAAPQGQDITNTQAFAHRLKEATERARQEERDALISRLYGDTHGIHTYADYEKAAAEYQRQQELNRLMQENIPREYAEKLMKVDELERWRQETASREAAARAERARKERNASMLTEFLNEFPDYGTEEQWRTIPPEVFAEAKRWVETNGLEGRRLADAFARYLYGQTVRNTRTSQTNRANSLSSTGSAKGLDAPPVGFVSREVYEQNKHDQGWMMRNYEVVKKSMGRWR